MRLHHLALAASLVALAACGDARPTAQPAMPTPAVAAPAPVTTADGRWTGSVSRARGAAARACTAAGRATMTVEAGRAALAYGPRGGMSSAGTVGADGNITLADGALRVVRNRATGTLRSGDCNYNVALTRAPQRAARR